MVTIAVSGSARRILPAERGTLRLEIRSESPSREEAVGVTTALHRRLAAEAAAYVASAAASAWSADRITVSTYRRPLRESDATEVVHVAAASLTATFVSIEALGEWIASVAVLEGVELNGVDWDVAPERRLEMQRSVRVAAVLDARERADAYASALGLTDLRLLAVYEPGLRPGQDGGGEGGGSARAMFAAKAAPALQPEDIEITAVVSADFDAR